MMEKDLKYGLRRLKISKKERSLLVIMDLIMMKITNKLFVNVSPKTAVDIYLEQSQDGE